MSRNNDLPPHLTTGLPPRPELKACPCGNQSPDIRGWEITASFFIKCPRCGRYTTEFFTTKRKHGVTKAAEAWNKGKIYEPEHK
jgi:hypothetical protein